VSPLQSGPRNTWLRVLVRRREVAGGHGHLKSPMTIRNLQECRILAADSSDAAKVGQKLQGLVRETMLLVCHHLRIKWPWQLQHALRGRLRHSWQVCLSCKLRVHCLLLVYLGACCPKYVLCFLCCRALKLLYQQLATNTPVSLCCLEVVGDSIRDLLLTARPADPVERPKCPSRRRVTVPAMVSRGPPSMRTVRVTSNHSCSSIVVVSAAHALSILKPALARRTTLRVGLTRCSTAHVIVQLAWPAATASSTVPPPRTPAMVARASLDTSSRLLQSKDSSGISARSCRNKGLDQVQVVPAPAVGAAG
ncbi:hypothetical protein HaLaN_27034, partial [Haematococcus lacustris]